MALDTDDEILQDFLVEAGEILDQLNQQLVDLEQQPDDYDLLNAVFRGFHTIKGGAGFLALDAMVEVCHRAEDVFNVLRQRQRTLDAPLMDVMLKVLDAVNGMFAQVKGGEEPTAAGRELIAALEGLAKPQAAPPEAGGEGKGDVPKPPATPEGDTSPVEALAPADEPRSTDDAPGAEARPADPAAAPAGAGSDEISDDEFEALLDQLHGKGRHGGVPASADTATPPAAAPSPGDAPSTPGDGEGAAAAEEMSEEEFEALLDQLHGKGRHGGVPTGDAAAVESAAVPPPADLPAAPGDEGGQEMGEEEFEALLDQLHGKGRHGGLPTGAPAPAAAPQRPKTQAGESVSEADAKPGSAPGRSPGPAAAESARRRAPTATEQTVRVETAKLDQIMNMVGELVLVRNRLFNLKSRVEDEGITSAVATLDVVTSDLQNAVMKTRMQPIKKVFGRFPRLVRDLSRSMGKEVDLRMSGEDTDLDKNLVEALADPMIHLIRNAVDHGIEPPSQREKIGKPRQGRLTLEASQEGEQIVLKIRDDGRGMDAETLRRMAVEKGLMDAAAAERLEDRECFNLIFEAGFSTKKEISDISGRGVGMDVVKTRIAQMSGTVDIDSETGGGTTITIKLPLTLAILPTLMVMLAQQPFAIPLSSVVEIINLDWKAIHVVDGQKTLLVRNQALPLFFLRRHLVKQAGQPVPGETAHVVVIDLQGSPVGLVVDGLVGQEEVVIKPLGALLRGVEGMAGATITGDGKIALILDLPGLMRKLARHRRDPSGRMASG